MDLAHLVGDVLYDGAGLDDDDVARPHPHPVERPLAAAVLAPEAESDVVLAGGPEIQIESFVRLVCLFWVH